MVRCCLGVSRSSPPATANLGANSQTVRVLAVHPPYSCDRKCEGIGRRTTRASPHPSRGHVCSLFETASKRLRIRGCRCPWRSRSGSVQHAHIGARSKLQRQSLAHIHASATKKMKAVTKKEQQYQSPKLYFC